MRPTLRPLLAAALLAATATLASAQAAPAPAAAPAAPAGPAVGELAPDFTAAWADASGPRATPVTLSALRGQVVVLAFYPRDRSSGCTAELTRFRDEHATLFGDGVVVLPISVDADTTHASWAKEMSFPFALVADPDLAVAERYGSRVPGRATSARTVYVIGRDGRVTYREPKFNALAENAYVTLAAEVRKARESR